MILPFFKDFIKPEKAQTEFNGISIPLFLRIDKASLTSWSLITNPEPLENFTTFIISSFLLTLKFLSYDFINRPLAQLFLWYDRRF